MRRAILCGIALAWMGAGYLQTRAAGETSRSAQMPDAGQYRVVLDRYCVGCHNQNVRTAELLLDRADLEQISEEPEVWEKVVRKLRTGAMPPMGMPRPDQATSDSLATYLEGELDRAAAARPNSGRPVLHRLNRVEYTNAVRDLLEVHIEGESLFPAEDSGKGFDNLAALLSVSPVLMERYMSAAAKISRRAVGDPAIRVAAETYDIAKRRRSGAGLLNVQDERVGDDLPFGSRGGMAIRHHFAADGEYQIKVRLQLHGKYNIFGLLGEPHQLDVFLDHARIASLTVGGESHDSSGRQDTRSDGKYLPPEGNIYVREGRFQAKAGSRLVGVTFQKKPYAPEGLLEVGPRRLARDVSDYLGFDPGVGSITITGPYNPTGVGNTLSRGKIFVCRPNSSSGSEASLQRVSVRGDRNEEESCAREILSRLARRAYRRPVTDDDLQPLLSLYRAGYDLEGFEEGIRLAIEGMLSSPQFLFRIERDPLDAAPDTAYPVNDLELASRLSFFLWSSIPDDALLEVAATGKLRDPGVLEQQVSRMLADRRSQALVSNFAGQWLYLRNLGLLSPSTAVFPDFDEELRYALQRETELFFNSMLREDRPVSDLLDADYTFVNARLALHYGIPSIYGSHFRRVRLTDENRHGLLGQGSFLTVTSRDSRTSPVIRGKWVLENLLGTPPPPPPPEVPALNEKAEEVRHLTMRQRIEAHSSNPACAGCHVRMDPIGFALENFDGVGRWRTTESGTAIEASAMLPDGTRFQGPVELRKALLSRPEQLAQTVTEKLLTYALGREVESSDMPAVRKILREAAPGYRWSSLISGVIESVPFQMRRSQP